VLSASGGCKLSHNGITVNQEYIMPNEINVGTVVRVVITAEGELHFFVDGNDLGVATSGCAFISTFISFLPSSFYFLFRLFLFYSYV
jgi:hypothetical protein